MAEKLAALLTFCRLCLQRSEEEQLVEIYEHEKSSQNSGELSLSRKILECVSIEVSHFSNGPKKICLKCLNHINSWFDFKASCNVANDVLQKYLHELEETNEPKYPEIIEEANKPETPEMRTITEDSLFFPEISLLSCDTLLEKSMSLQSNISSIVNYFLSPEKTKKNESESGSVEFDGNFSQQIVKFDGPTPATVSSTTGSPKATSKLAKVEKTQSKIEEKGYHCVLCDRNFKHFSLFLSHDDSIHFTETRKYSCSICGRLFILEDRLNIHKRLAHRQKTHQCRICDKLFVSAKSLEVHSRLHSEKYKCEKCGYLTTSKLYLNHHLQKHAGVDVSFTCDICQQIFSQKAALLRHNKLHSQTHGKCFRCSICSSLFRSHSELVSHRKIHTGENTSEVHKCRTCGKLFYSRKTLVAHQKRHQEPKFSCQVCDKKLLSNYDLRLHMGTHSDDKTFTCFHCNKRFSFEKTLSRHLKKCFPSVRSDLIV